MANLYAEAFGQRSTKGCVGSKEVSSHTRPWSLGAEVQAFYDKKTDKTLIRIYATKGSNGGGRKLIFEFDDYDKILPCGGITADLSPI